MFKDGAQAWEAKDFLLDQKDLKECSVENKVYHGYYTTEVRARLSGVKKAYWGLLGKSR